MAIEPKGSGIEENNSMLSLNRFLAEFSDGIRTTMVESWILAFLSNNIGNATGSAFGQMGLYLFMDIMGLPTPKIGDFKISSNVIGYSSLLKGDPMFFLKAQNAYYSAMIEFYKGLLSSTNKIAADKNNKIHILENRIPFPNDMLLGYAPARHELTWRGRPLMVTTSSEWISQVEGSRPQMMVMGSKCYEIIRNDRGFRRVYWASEIIRNSEKSEIMARNCCMSLSEPSLVRHMILPEHPFSTWLSGHKPMGDAFFNLSEISIKPCVVGEWAMIDENSPIRRAVIEALSR